MKGDADMLTVYNQKYNEAIARLKNLGEGENTTDQYRDDVLKIPRT
jgi:hypothetical protein